MEDVDSFVRDIQNQGYAIVTEVLDREYIARAKTELMAAIEQEARLPFQTHFGMVLLCSLYGGAFLDLFVNRRLVALLEAVLGEGCIVYGYTSSSMPPGESNYSARIHVDSPRLIPGFITNLGVILLLDDFTEANGATWYLPHSQLRSEPLDEDYFWTNARQLIASAGTAFFFNARLWHHGGQNRTSEWRHALTVNMCRPWMKQRLDIPRAMAHIDLTGVSDVVLQKLGFFAQVPASYEEFHATPERRKYRQKPE